MTRLSTDGVSVIEIVGIVKLLHECMSEDVVCC